METYQEMKERHQREFNALPIGAAFREEGFRRMMEGWGLTMEEVDKIYSIGHGFYTDGNSIIVEDEVTADVIADFLEMLGFGVYTGDCDERYGYYNGFYYIKIE